PVLSWLLLRGRCRSCGAPIAWRYPLIEAVTAALFVACVERFGASLGGAAAALFCCLMIALGGIDLEHFILPDRLTLPGIAIGLLLRIWLPWGGLGPAVFGALLGAGILLAVYGAWLLVRREEGMGLGDVKMLALVGAFLGWQEVLVTLFLA